jgi:imidazolonepropionase-like amidohydrolase
LALVNIGELATCPPGNAQDDAGLIRDAALVVGDGRVDWCGPAAKLPDAFHGIDRHDCDGALVIPGLVDCHTHLCFGGWRGDEFEMRLRGMDYREIAAAGGGIIGTVEATRAATKAQLLEKARNALDGMLALGVTTVECKSGYGLDVETELKPGTCCHAGAYVSRRTHRPARIRHGSRRLRGTAVRFIAAEGCPARSCRFLRRLCRGRRLYRGGGAPHPVHGP